MFFPDKLHETYTFNLGDEVELQVSDSLFINVLHIKERSSKGVILYFHGNKGSNKRCLYQTRSFSGSGYDIFMPDYRGYGKSDGKIESEEQLLKDAEVAYEYLLKHYDESNIVILGYSLGTGMATYLAAEHNPKCLILNSPYESFIDLKNRKFPIVPSFLIKYPFKNIERINAVKCPIFIFHGKDDNVIPFSSSENLLSNSNKADLIPLENTSHRQAIFSNKFSREVARILTE